jgi:hypothetical protein
VLDNISGLSQGLHAVFYPVGGTWQHSKAVMYGNGWSKDLATNQTIEQFMTYDSTQFLAHGEPVQVLDVSPITLSSGKRALIRKFLYSQNEIIAYIDEPLIVAMIVMTARSSADFQEAFPQFENLVKSYNYLGDNQLKKATDFYAALKAADENLNRPFGQQYDDKVGRSVSKWLTFELTRYTAEVPDSGLASFTVLIRVDSSGRAQEVLSQPMTIVAKRVEPAFKAAFYPLPPASSWWVKVHIELVDR